MRNSRLDRILYIQQVLVQGGVLNKQQTADRFGVSEKTIQRDLDTLRSYFADSVWTFPECQRRSTDTGTVCTAGKCIYRNFIKR